MSCNSLIIRLKLGLLEHNSNRTLTVLPQPGINLMRYDEPNL